MLEGGTLREIGLHEGPGRGHVESIWADRRRTRTDARRATTVPRPDAASRESPAGGAAGPRRGPREFPAAKPL